MHGLNGNAFTTWTNKKSQLWLQEFLPGSLPKARIYTFGYDSSIFSQSKAGIEEYARKLLSELSLVRQSETVCDSCYSPEIQAENLISRINDVGSYSSATALEGSSAKRFCYYLISL